MPIHVAFLSFFMMALAMLLYAYAFDVRHPDETSTLKGTFVYWLLIFVWAATLWLLTLWLPAVGFSVIAVIFYLILRLVLHYDGPEEEPASTVPQT